MIGLGARIKELRKKRHMTLKEISEKTEIDPATLSRIENGRMTGTIESHMQIAEALGVALPQIYQDVLTKSSEQKEEKARQKLEAFSHSTGAVSELLTRGFLQKKMMPIRLRIRGSGRTENEEYPEMTERFVYVLKGKLEVHIGKESRALGTGDSLYFDASQTHYFRNPLKSEMDCLSIITPVSL